MAWFDIFKAQQIQKASFVEAYEALFQKPQLKELPISELLFTVLDTETTGLNSKHDELVSYGSIQVKEGIILVKSVKEYYLQSSKQSKEAIKVHGIVKQEGFTRPEVFVKEMLEEIKDTIVVAHHAGFDKAMLEKAAKPYGLKRILNPVVDTYALAVRLEIGKNYNPRLVHRTDYSLDKLCERYHISLDDRHTAAGDAFLTAQLLLKLLKKAERVGIKTYGDLMGY
ncbi:MAG TPA: 3'-5' exonuclease [Cyclobacteriaceae bacterium]|nr:3'-5' exonuclease [Cyclobacteriaceae bacterium]